MLLVEEMVALTIVPLMVTVLQMSISLEYNWQILIILLVPEAVDTKIIQLWKQTWQKVMRIQLQLHLPGQELYILRAMPFG